MDEEEPLMSATVVRRRFTVGEYRRMGETGILTEDDRVELIGGEIVQMTPIGLPHAAAVVRLNHLFTARAAGRALVSPQNPLYLDDLSEPQPDLVLLLPRADFYAAVRPRPADALLVIEVADTSLGYDRDVKAPLYAAAGVRELWIIDLHGQALEIYREPSTQGYRQVRLARPGETVSVSALPDVAVRVEEILGE
jgi:Uma2 family endonuclease